MKHLERLKYIVCYVLAIVITVINEKVFKYIYIT